ncbi:MAG: hypothetical protein ACLRZ2_00170 [Veillonella sp.]
MVVNTKRLMLYNDKDEQALKEIKNYNTESTRTQGYFIGGRDNLTHLSPYMKKIGQGEIKLTNPLILKIIGRVLSGIKQMKGNSSI